MRWCSPRARKAPRKPPGEQSPRGTSGPAGRRRDRLPGERGGPASTVAADAGDHLRHVRGGRAPAGLESRAASRGVAAGSGDPSGHRAGRCDRGDPDRRPACGPRAGTAARGGVGLVRRPHPGGAGTIVAALCHGLPHLILPRGADQFVNSARAADAGVAPRVRGGRPGCPAAGPVPRNRRQSRRRTPELRARSRVVQSGIAAPPDAPTTDQLTASAASTPGTQPSPSADFLRLTANAASTAGRQRSASADFPRLTANAASTPARQRSASAGFFG